MKKKKNYIPKYLIHFRILYEFEHFIFFDVYSFTDLMTEIMVLIIY